MLRRSLILNLLLALLLVAGLGYGFFNSLNYITNHGQEITVPKLKGKKLKKVLEELKALKFKVEIDSTYKASIDPHLILRQEPSAGSKVKIGRTIFILVNRAAAPKVDMPNLVSKSFRNAVLILKSHRFVMGDTIYRPDIAAGAVLEQLINGKKVMPGTKVPFGSRIDLVVGEGLADYEVDVPNLIGKSWRDARDILTSAGLFHLLVYDGKIDDTMGAIVYKQYPEALNELDFPNAIRGGDMIDIHLMQNPSAQILRKNAPGSLKFQDLDDSLADVIMDRLKNANTTLQKAKKASAENNDTDLGDGLNKREVDKNNKSWEDPGGNKKAGQNKQKDVVDDKSDQDFSNEYE